MGTPTKTRYKHIRFEADPDGWVCLAKGGGVLGGTLFYPRWKQYIFQPNDAVFSHDCLTDIADFLKQLNAPAARSGGEE